VNFSIGFPGGLSPEKGMRKIQVIDSHTGGEPTRLVMAGGPALPRGHATQQLEQLRQEDWLRRAVMQEPRGHDVLVGALLTESAHPEADYGLIFFNNVGYLGMCGHGTIGVVATLAYLGQLQPGVVKFDTPVGLVAATLEATGAVTVANVPSYRTVKDLAVRVPFGNQVVGDVAWGGNWFFLVKEHGQTLALEKAEQLTDFCWAVRQAVNAAGYPEVDHIELFGPPQAGGHSRNFVLCPGKAYDRSPCGTGTSAKLACLAADGKLQPGETWVQESIVGSSFAGRFTWVDEPGGPILPVISGRAYVMAEATLLLDPADPFQLGL
jgi:4-hydroxyproline epimerase